MTRQEAIQTLDGAAALYAQNSDAEKFLAEVNAIKESGIFEPHTLWLMANGFVWLRDDAPFQMTVQ